MSGDWNRYQDQKKKPFNRTNTVYDRAGFHKIGDINNGKHEQGIGAMNLADVRDQYNASMLKLSKILGETARKLELTAQANQLLELENARLKREIDSLKKQLNH